MFDKFFFSHLSKKSYFKLKLVKLSLTSKSEKDENIPEGIWHKIGVIDQYETQKVIREE